MLNKREIKIAIALLSALSMLLAGCGSAAEQGTPTLSVGEIQTQAVATFSADLTATALAMPTETSTPTESPTPTVSVTPAGTSTATSVGAAPTASCYGMTYVSDVTIPDNTNMSPGEQFTKTWRVRNSGSCAWQAGFNFRFTSGEAMGGSTVALQNAVQPGSETNLSVQMTAPSTPGTYRSNWRMTTASGTFFGDEVYVLIVVGSSTATATTQASATPAPSNTPEP